MNKRMLGIIGLGLALSSRGALAQRMDLPENGDLPEPPPEKREIFRVNSKANNENCLVGQKKENHSKRKKRRNAKKGK